MRTAKTLVTAGAASQSASPACEATMNTWPVAVKIKVVESSICAGPEATENATGRPELAVAESPQTLVTS